MSDHFWKTLEKSLNYDIPNFMKTGFTLCGYSNPISFRTVDENDISNVEKILREKGQSYAINNQCKLLGDSQSDSNEMVDHFGELYAENPGEFQFMDGDKIFIREIVKHVRQLVDGDGPLTGLEQFRPKKKKKLNYDATTSVDLKQDIIDHELDTTHALENQTETLRTELMKSTCSLFNSYDIDVNKWSIQLVDVEVTPNGIYGYINCVLCFEESKQMPEPRRVYYQQSTQRSSYWVLANFHKHMRTVHPSVEIKPKVTKKKKICSKNMKTQLKRMIKSERNTDEIDSKKKSVEQATIKSECIPNDTRRKSVERTISKSESDSDQVDSKKTFVKRVMIKSEYNTDEIKSKNESVECTVIKSESNFDKIESEDKSAEFIPSHEMGSEFNIDADEESMADKYNFSVEYVPVEKASSSDDSELWLFEQISNQINEMVCATIVSSQKQDTLQFNLKQKSKSLTVIKINGDGNCLFSAITHQLWPESTADKNHTKKTKQLRKDVVEHILKPDNFPMYEIAVQETMGSTNNLNAVDATIGCKLWVRHTLSRSGKWGGLETIKAVSNMYRVNVVIFAENSACYMIKGCNEEFQRTILLAYRLGIGADGRAVHNHYDSVCDMDSETMFTAADFIINK